MLWVLLAILGLAGLVGVLAGETGTVLGYEAAVVVPALLSVALLLFVGRSLFFHRSQVLQGLKDLAVWVLIALGLVLAYSYRDVFVGAANRIAGELMPPGEVLAVDGQPADRAVRIRRRSDGHFVARTSVNGASATMLVDTGATSVVLTPADARQAGIDTQKLTYSVPVRTANGVAYAASIKIRSIGIGGIVFSNVDALVASPGTLGQSLLGMSFLTRLRSYEVSGEFMTLRI